MQFDHKYVYYRFLQGLARKLLHSGASSAPPNDRRHALPPLCIKVGAADEGEEGGEKEKKSVR